MDQMMLDCGPVGPSGAAHVAIGDEVVLIGQQGDECVRVEEWANALGTIAYEITCSIGDRVTRRYGNRPH